MKKIVLLLLLISAISFAQKQASQFEVTKDGFPDYVVLEFDGKTANEIYTQLQKWAQYNIRNATVSNYSEIQDEYLTYSIIYPNAIIDNLMAIKYDVGLDIELRIKPNRLRIDIILNNIIHPQGGRINTYALFKNNGDVRNNRFSKDAVLALNSLSKKITIEFENAINGSVDSNKSDW